MRILVLLGALVATSHTSRAAMQTVGTANYLGSDCDLIYDDNGPWGPLVWLDYRNPPSGGQVQAAWAASLGSSLTVSLYPDFSSDIDWSTGWRLPETNGVDFELTQALSLSGLFSHVPSDWYWVARYGYNQHLIDWRVNPSNNNRAGTDEGGIGSAIAVRPGIVNTIPEPATLCLLSLAGLVLVRRRKA